VDKSGPAARLRDMPNLGPASEAMLVAAGAELLAELDESVRDPGERWRNLDKLVIE
jgi:hypothetical protein